MLNNDELKKIQEHNLKQVLDLDMSDLRNKWVKASSDFSPFNSGEEDCLAKGYAPRNYGLADFSLIKSGEWYHCFYIPRVPKSSCLWRGHEAWLGHAITKDFDSWFTRDQVISADTSNDYEKSHVWAPHVYQHDGVWHMFYTGLNHECAQCLCHATSTDELLEVWEKDEDNPIIPMSGFDWQLKNSSGNVRHMRDPHIVKVDDLYLMAFTSQHKDGCPAVGAVVSKDFKTWEDIGPIFYRPYNPAWMYPGGWNKDHPKASSNDYGKAMWHPESVNLQLLPDGQWCLIPSQSPGMEVYFSDTPFSFHEAKDSIFIKYLDGPDEEPMAMEVVHRDDANNLWLVTFFKEHNNRLFTGELDIKKWELKRCDKDSIQKWLKKGECYVK